MKTLTVLSLFLLATFPGAALAETPVKATPADACPVIGPLDTTTKDCAALRRAYRAEVKDCMDKLHAEADIKAGRRTDATSHSSRSRYLICDKSVQQAMALRVN
jgi:hypothetical protein